MLGNYNSVRFPDMKVHVAVVCVYIVAFGVYEVLSQTFGGAACTIPTSAPGATTQCTSTANGFCALDTLTTSAPITATGKCICFQTTSITYSGSSCATATPVTSSTTTSTTATSSSNSALGLLAVGSLAAYLLAQPTSFFGGGTGIFGDGIAGDGLL